MNTGHVFGMYPNDSKSMWFVGRRDDELELSFLVSSHTNKLSSAYSLSLGIMAVPVFWVPSFHINKS